MTSDADDALLQRLRAGDEEAFEVLFVRHYSLVYGVLYRLMSDRQAAEDVAQETFLALHQQPPRVELNGGLAAWLCRVALHRGYNALRGERRARQQILQARDPSTTPDPEAELMRAEERAGVRAALGDLPERQGKLLLLRHAGFSYAEIAAVLEVAPGSIGTLLVRAERAFLEAYRRANPAGREEELDVGLL